MLEQFNAVDVPLTNGGFATVDIADAPRVLLYRWFGHLSYARSCSLIAGKRCLLHRFIMGATSDEQLDHKDGNGLNNRRSNLRTATSSENNSNRRVQRNNKSGIKGVSRPRRSKGYQARIQVNGRERYLGTFDTPQEAARAYMEAARLLHGNFARTG